MKQEQPQRGTNTPRKIGLVKGDLGRPQEMDRREKKPEIHGKKQRCRCKGGTTSNRMKTGDKVGPPGQGKCSVLRVVLGSPAPSSTQPTHTPGISPPKGQGRSRPSAGPVCSKCPHNAALASLGRSFEVLLTFPRLWVTRGVEGLHPGQRAPPPKGSASSPAPLSFAPPSPNALHPL